MSPLNSRASGPIAPPRPAGRSAFAATAVLALLLATWLAPTVSAARAASATKVVAYHGLRFTVPASWPVYDLARHHATCVRFNRHAVYLGVPSQSQRCPAHTAGRTEALLVSPIAMHAGLNRSAATPVPASAASASPAGGSATRIVNLRRGVTVFATWDRHPALVRRALGLRSLSPWLAARHTAHASRQAAARKASAAAPGAAYTGLGFDACSTPNPSQMAAWGSSPYRAIGVYIGGTNMACSQAQLTSSWVSAETNAGWHLIPIYVGLQAPGNSCGCAAISSASAASEGTAAAVDAVAQAQSIGLGTGNPIYFDMEAYPRGGTHTSAVLAFLGAWTSQLHASGYRSGVYASDDSGVEDLVAQVGTGYAEPDDLWMANWNGVRSTSDSRVPASDWPNHQRLHQYSGGANQTYGGVTINVDGDYVDASTASPGAGSIPASAPPPPALSVSPAADGSIALRPSWSGGPAVTSWQILGGSSATALTPAMNPVGASSHIVLHSAFPYFAARALDANGQTLGTSGPVATPSHLTVAGSSAFVPPRGLGGVPVGCFNTTTCHVSAKITAGRSTLASTGSERVSVGGGVVLFKLTTSARRTLARSHHVAVTLALHEASGLTATRSINLIQFLTTGRGPSRNVAQSHSIEVLGLTDYVSHGWVGGILAGCHSSAPCHVQTTIYQGKTVIARTGTEFLGANELGYLVFTLTKAGHAMLLKAPGNQLVARVISRNGSDLANARVALVAFS